MLDLGTVRAKAVRRLCSAFEDRARALGIEADHATLGKHLEICAWNVSLESLPSDAQVWENPQLRRAYTTKCLALEQNLRHPRNPQLVTDLLEKRLGLKRFVRMHPYEMFPDQWTETFERVAARQLSKIITLESTVIEGSTYPCKKCKSLRTTYTLIQTRSADEPSTAFFFCSDCDYRWKTQ